MHVQTKLEDIKYPCDQCDSAFTQRSHLNRHIQSKHEGIRYLCNQCEYQATQKSVLLQHIMSKHEGIKSFHTGRYRSKKEGIKYLCDQCDDCPVEKITMAPSGEASFGFRVQPKYFHRVDLNI